ncbi:Succinate dehydrogenase/Fumarate reductase transmembrane subunit [Aquisphaera giovannonii]|uniref:Succinate dehydrogenase/Fumarate reductase transmembrane subunit n=1 Tax=Aquisphaera giovannonii TaxID=406548 RepID=A0A5B9VV90_9BACT|nr:succinate dehydrogenase cytochrome b subunit [Aquisphaera giovannonii]QEH31847.1 Succinate dehydrogenase/Fumarate reductase transmembrane subunit [Aquisphaera giovannonii]
MSVDIPIPAKQRKPARQTRLARMLNSSIGLKITMALTGVVLSGFVLGHMLGNLQAFQGAEALNAYGALLHKEPALLWAVRLFLLLNVGLHIYAYLALGRKNRAARPQAYQSRKYRESSLASRSMRITGPLLLAFIVYHLLHLTVGKPVHPDYVEGDVYHNLAVGLAGLAGVIYILAMLALAFHLWHGVWSLFQTLGLPEARYESLGRRVATIFTVLVTAGFIAIPLAVLAGVIKVQ